MPQLYDLLIKNEELKQSISISQYSCFANAVFPFYSFMSTICFIEKRTDQLLWLVFVPGALNVILCIIFIPIFGYKAALVTTIVSYWSQLLIPFFIKFHKENTRIWFRDLRKVLLLLLLLISLMFVSTCLSGMCLIYKILISFLLCLVVCVFLKYCTTKNII